MLVTRRHAVPWQRWLGQLFAVLALVACGRMNFEDINNQATDPIDGSISLPGDGRDGDPSVNDAALGTPDAGDMAMADAASMVGDSEISLIGSNDCGGITHDITLSAPANVGDVVFLQVARRGGGDLQTVTDSVGNSYQIVNTASAQGLSLHLVRTTVTQAISNGTTMQVNFQSNVAATTRVFRWALAGAESQQSMAGDTTASFSRPVAPQASGIVYCGGATADRAFTTVAAGWNSLGTSTVDCGGSNGVIANYAAWMSPASDGFTSCDGEQIAPVSTNPWTNMILGYLE